MSSARKRSSMLWLSGWGGRAGGLMLGAAVAMTVSISNAHAQTAATPANGGATAGAPAGVAAKPKVSAAEASKADKAEAAKHFTRGVKLSTDTDFRGALVEYKKSYETVAEPVVLFNIAQTEFQLNDYAAAQATFQQYLREGGTRIAPARRSEVEATLETLAERVAKVTIRVSVPDAEIVLDDVVLTPEVLAQPIVVSQGKRTLKVEKAGYKTYQETIEIAGGETRELKVDLVAIVINTPPPRIIQRSLPWPAYAVTGALGAGTVVMGILALGASNKVRDLKSQPNPNATDLENRASSARTLGIVTDILLVSTVVAGGISVYFTLKSPSADAKPQTSAKLYFTGSGVSALATW